MKRPVIILRSGKFIIACPSKNIKVMVGSYTAGELEGEGRVTSEAGGVEEVEFRRGAVHGLVRRMDGHGEVVWVGNYHFGEQRGLSWRFLRGGGILTGFEEKF